MPLPERAASPEKEIWDLGVEWQQSDDKSRRQKRTRTMKHAALLSATPVREDETALAPMRLDLMLAMTPQAQLSKC